MITRQDLLMLWRFSRFESVREVAQNPDILKLILTELKPMFQYNRVVTEYNDPRYKTARERAAHQQQQQQQQHETPGASLAAGMAGLGVGDEEDDDSLGSPEFASDAGEQDPGQSR